MKVKVSGYPSNKDAFCYSYEGAIREKMKTELGGWVIYYDVDTTPGNSGSEI